jgi:Lipid A 3-O-deacylase (PagL)
VHLRPARRALICLATLGACAPHAARAGSVIPCWSCDVMVGVGTTFSPSLRPFAWTDGLVLPVMLELDDSRWELGALRFATAQHVVGVPLTASTRAASPYWGFTAMRRWQVSHRGRTRLYLGVGANYRTEEDYLEATRWNFAYLIAVRFDLDGNSRTVELGVRHWSDAWIRPPNRGQNLLTLSFGF